MTASSRFYRVGAGRVEITPPLDVPYLSFAPRHQPFAAVHDPLHARAIAISHGESRGVIIGAEAIGFINSALGEGRDFTTEVRAEVERRTGVPAGSVMLAAAHVHSTPDSIDIRPLRETPAGAAWLEGLIGKLALAAERALADTFEASLLVGQGGFPGYSKNRRGEDCLDDLVTILEFASPDRRGSVILVNYACHPVIVQAQDRVSADYVGVMAAALERTVAGLEACIFLQGADGDINPWIDDTRDFADVDRMGRALADRVTEILAEMRRAGGSPGPVALRFASERLELPSRPLPSAEEAGASVPGEGRLWLGAELEARRREGAGPFPAEIQAVKIGGAILAGIPGEPFCRLGKAIRELALPLTGIPVGYANGYVGYIVPPESWPRGGYEVEPGPWSKVAPGSHALILDAAARLFARI